MAFLKTFDFSGSVFLKTPWLTFLSFVTFLWCFSPQSVSFHYLYSYEIVCAPDMGFGKRVDGKWDGLVGQLDRREVDLVIAALTIHQDREEVMDFLYPPIFTFSDDIMYRLHSEDEDRWQMYLRPFQPLVLLLLFITLVVSSVFGYILWRHDVFHGSEQSQDHWKCGICGIPYTFFILLGLLLMKGLGYRAGADSSRLLLFTWALTSVILAASFSANLVSIFTVPKPKLPFRNLEELVRQKEYKWGFMSGDIREHIFKLSRTREMELFWEGIIAFNKTDPDVMSENMSVHVAKVKSEKYAFLDSRLRINRAISTDCKIHPLGHDIIWHQCGIGVPTGYPLSRLLENVLASIADSGLLDIWWQRWGQVNTDHCAEYKTGNTLTLSDIISAFYLLFVGLVAAGIALLMENVKHKIMCK